MTSEDGPIIRNLAAITENHLPTDIVARDSQVRELQACLAPASQGNRPLDVWLHGKPGSGKTTVARHVASQLEHNTRVYVVYVNCWQLPTLFMVLQRIVESLRIVVPDNAMNVVKLHRIRSQIGNAPLVVMLDEIDKAQPKDRNSILYTLADMGNTGVVCISNSRAPLLTLEGRVRSRVNPRIITFEPYGAEDLRRILDARAKQALAPNSYTPELLEKIARLAGGDARVAIHTLRQAAQQAETQGAPSISIDQIEHLLATSRTLKTQYTLGKLTEHHQMLYNLVQAAREIHSPALWAAYWEKCKEANKQPVAERTFTNYLNVLVNQGFLRRELTSLPGVIFAYRLAE